MYHTDTFNEMCKYVIFFRVKWASINIFQYSITVKIKTRRS